MDRLENLSLESYLPPEILDIIFDIVSKEAGRDLVEFKLNSLPLLSTNYSAKILPLTLVCRSWTTSANRVLYRDVSVTRIGQLPSLLANSVRNLPLINHLRVSWNRQPWILPQDPELALIPDLLNLSPYLSQITLAGEQFDLSSPQLLEALSRRSNSSFYAPITSLCCCALEVSYIDQRFGPTGRRTSSTLNNLLAACGTFLVEARFDEFRSSYHLLSTVPQDCVAFVPSIRRIVLEKVVVESGYLGQLLSQLSQGNLKELSLIRTTLGSTEAWREIIKSIGGKLEVLELNESDFYSTWENEDDEPKATVVDAILESCPLLAKLTLIGSLDSQQPLFETLLPNLKVLTSECSLVLCECVLNYLLLVGTRIIKPDVVQAAIQIGYWPSLKKLAVLRGSEWSQGERRQVFEVAQTIGLYMEGLWN